MQFSVMLGILLTVLNNKRVTREQLAQKYEIDKRTVSRYIASISGAGVPIISYGGKSGGITLPDSYRLDRSFFSIEELKRLSTCIHATQSGFNDGLNTLLLDKINNMAQNKEDEKYLLKSDTLIIDVGTWSNPQAYRNKIEAINRAIAGEFSLNLVYIDRHDLASERVFDPYSLVLKEGVWYVYGFCRLRGDFRLFKLSRIRSLTLAHTQFSRRESNVYQKLSEAFGEKNLLDIEIQFSSIILSEIEEWLGTEAIADNITHYTARATLYGGNLLINKLLSFGSSVKVISPTALREELLTECKRIFNNYGTN